jgi:hypothetical protein
MEKKETLREQGDSFDKAVNELRIGVFNVFYIPEITEWLNNILSKLKDNK